ncbi:galactosamine-6-phosphate isomerase [Roseivirga pacifica]|uniref:galactosamine-6-phosphate isomerase n=1 Tax=Roseivirga pacifica TaxID=1267423 RepID=UPI003BAD71F8
MKITNCESYDQLSALGAEVVLDCAAENPNLLLCAATGNSPLGLYRNLGQSAEQMKKTRVIKLDEWGGIPMSHPASCEYYLQHEVVKPLGLAPQRYFGFQSKAANPESECARMAAVLNEQGPIDLCVLGLGKNGHIGFNEPAEALTDHCHIATLASSSQAHSMVQALQDKPTYGLTLGIKDILSAKRILLLVSGEGKADAREKLFSKQVSSQFPASYLWQHASVTCLVHTPD